MLDFSAGLSASFFGQLSDCGYSAMIVTVQFVYCFLKEVVNVLLFGFREEDTENQPDEFERTVRVEGAPAGE